MSREPRNLSGEAKAWDVDEELRKLIGNNDELGAIYRTLGYSVYIDQESQRTLNQLKSLLGNESGYFNAFRKSLEGIPEKGFGYVPETLGHVTKREANDFLATMQTEEDNPGKLKSLLIGKLLDRLEGLCMDARSPLSARGRDALISAATCVRHAAERNGCESPYLEDLPRALKLLDMEREHWCGLARDFSDDDPAHEQKAQLDELLSNSLWARQVRGPDDAQWHQDAAKQAKNYIDSTWMHTPWLTARFLTDLLDVELAPLSREAKTAGEGELMLTSRLLPSYYYLRLRVAWTRARLARLAGLLGLVRDEVDSGNYDAQEIAGRFRRFEVEGLYVHSLVYALLRLDGSSAQAVKVSGE